MDAGLTDLLSHALRVVFLVAIPIVVFVALAGTLVAALQAVTTVHDSAARYAARIIALLLVLYFLAPVFSSHVIRLAEVAFSQ